MKNRIITTCFCFCFAASAYAQDAQQGANRNTTDNIDASAGYLLPEVSIAEVVQPATLADDESELRADEFDKLDMRLYTVKLEKQIAKNETVIASIKEKLQPQRGKEALKKWKQVTALEVQNEELKRDLSEYLHYGKGSWTLFKEDFNEDMRPLVDDLAKMEQEVQ
jgi:hypothetical protein